METREVPVLSSVDRPIVTRLAAGMSDDAATILTYLVLRSTQPGFTDAATIAEVQLGTDLGRQPAKNALSTLVDRELADRTTVTSEAPGRPPTAWSARGSVREVANRVYDDHARSLLDRAEEIAETRMVERNDDSSTEGGGSAGGSTDAESDDGSSGGERAEAERVTVGLNWEPNALHLPLYAADVTGAYERRGLSVSFEAHVGSSRAVQSVAAGEATVGVAGAATVARARAASVPVAPIAALFQRSMVVLYSTKEMDRPLDAPGAIDGMRIGMPTGSETALLGRLFLSQSGLLDSVEVVDLDDEEYEAMARGDVDAVTGVFSDPLRLEREGVDVDVVRVAEQYPMPGPVLVAGEDRIPSPALRAFLAGSVAGWVEATQSSATAAEAVAEESDLDPAHVQETFERAVERFGTTAEVNERGWGWLSPGDWQRLEEALSQLDLLGR